MQTDGEIATSHMQSAQECSPSQLLELMRRKGLLSEDDSNRLREVLDNSSVLLDQALAELGLVTEETVAEFYAEHYGAPRWRGGEGRLSAAIGAVNKRFLERRRMIPDGGDDPDLLVVDPGDDAGAAGVEFALQRKLPRKIITASEFERLFAALAARDDPPSPEPAQPLPEDATRLKDIASAAPAVRLLNRLIVEASRARSSDIHIEPKERDVQVRRRVDGVLSFADALTKAQGLAVISRLKILANLDIAERRRPQDGRLSFPIGGRPVDMRVSTAPTIYGESVVIRLLDKPAAAQGLDALGFSAGQMLALQRIIGRPNGIVLVTGPTGSGKTTTLYALLEMLANRELKILTIEDPVEYRIDGVSQTQINSSIGLDFANAMRSFLRHDPDVIMVGEMRDLETAKTAIQAALTGHLVLSTLHTNDAPSAVTRLLDMGLEDYLVSSTLTAVIAQRLVRRLCGGCQNLPEKRSGCPHCQGGGYAGRLAVAEILEIDEPVKAFLTKGVTASDLRKAAQQRGFDSMKDDADAKSRQGHTDAAELARVLGANDGA